MTRAILITDASHMFRDGLNAWLSTRFPLCRIFEAESAEKALMLAETEYIDVALIEIRLPGMNGLEATRELKARLPHMKVLLMTMFEESEYRRYASVVGANGCVNKSRIDELTTAMESLLAPSPSGSSGADRTVKKWEECFVPTAPFIQPVRP